MEDRIGMVLATRGEQRRETDRQRGRTRFADARPAQAGKKRHVVSLYRRSEPAARPAATRSIEIVWVEHAEPTGSKWSNQAIKYPTRR
jgi:hypothetical protein